MTQRWISITPTFLSHGLCLSEHKVRVHYNDGIARKPSFHVGGSTNSLEIWVTHVPLHIRVLLWFWELRSVDKPCPFSEYFLLPDYSNTQLYQWHRYLNLLWSAVDWLTCQYRKMWSWRASHDKNRVLNFNAVLIHICVLGSENVCLRNFFLLWYSLVYERKSDKAKNIDEGAGYT